MFPPKEKRISNYDWNVLIEKWMNPLSRKSLRYSIPEERFEKERDRIDAT